MNKKDFNELYFTSMWVERYAQVFHNESLQGFRFILKRTVKGKFNLYIAIRKYKGYLKKDGLSMELKVAEFDTNLIVIAKKLAYEYKEFAIN